MRIEAPEHFRHAAELNPRVGDYDPRQPIGEDVIVDLRGCEFVRPAAVLWCLVVPLLAQASGSKAALWVPEHMGVCVYLKSLGLFRELSSAGVEVDDREVRQRTDPQIVLPLTGFSTEFEVEDVANRSLEALQTSGLGASNLYPFVSEVFAELALNAVQHSESPINAFGFIQFFRFAEGERFVCGVADGGIGIRRSLERNPELVDRVPYDWVAIELALRERVSGTGDRTRGIGLYGIAEDMRRPRHRLIVHSGMGSLQISEEIESQAKRATLFPGTLVYASIPT
jgi:hypothetical protein